MAEWWNVLSALQGIRRRSVAGTMQLADTTVRENADEFGTSGTETFAGAVVGDEYNPILRWPNAVRVYDEIRRSDPDARATLLILKLPILRADEAINPPDKGDTTDKAIADFCTWVLLTQGLMRISMRKILRHLLLRLDFGFSAVELAWLVDTFDGRPVYRFRRLAPRLPQTLQEWLVDQNGELTFMVQYAPKAGDWGEWKIPADYLCVTVHDREGDNYNGMSVLRGAYKPWYYKNQLEHIDMIRHHRFGAGLPEAKVQQGQKLTQTERQITVNTLSTLAASEAAFVITPAKLDLTIHHPPSGESGIMKSLEYHSFAIARSILANFLNNASEGMNTNRTKKLADVFMFLEESLANELTTDINEQIVRRLCDQNFDMTGRDYPRYALTNINPIDIGEVADTFQKLGGAGFVTPDDDLEAWLRRAQGAPPLPTQFSRAERIAAGLLPTEGAPGETPGTQPDQTNTTDEERAIAATERQQRLQDETVILSTAARIEDAGRSGKRMISARDGMLLAAAATIRAKRRLVQNFDVLLNTDANKPIEINGRFYSREATELERRVLALSEIPDKLDSATQTLTETVIKIRRTQLKAAARWFAAHDDITARPDDVPMPEQGDLFAAIRDAQTELENYGALQVRHELIRQGAPITLDDRDDAMDSIELARRKKERDVLHNALTASARSTADFMLSDWRSEIVDGAVRMRRTGMSGDELEAAMLRELDTRAEQGVLRHTKQQVNEAFGIGRAREAEKHTDIIARVVQSCLLDAHSCKPCRSVDGEEMKFNSGRQKSLAPPYRNCLGKESCRCTQLYIYENPADRAGEGRRLREGATL
jgi:hypothetical protein